MNVILKFFFSSLFILFFSLSLKSQVLWHGNPDLTVNDNFRRLDPNGNSNPTGSRCVDNSNTPPKVTTLTDNEFGKFWRITKPTSRKRAEFARTTGDRNSFTPQKGGAYYYGWRWRINSTPNINKDVTVFQWKTDEKGDINTNKQNYPLNMEYDGTVLTLNAFGPAEPNWNRPGSISARKTTLWTRIIQENEWVTFVIKINVDDSYDSVNNRYNGSVEFWFNGTKQILSNTGFNQYTTVIESNTKAYHKTFDGGEVYPKWGSYNENACNLEIITDFDDMRVAATFEEALPKNTNDANPSGLEGNYKIKHSETGKYWTVSNGNMIAIDEITPSSATQIFELKSVENSGYYNISSTDSNWDAVRFHEANVYPTTTLTPTIATNNTRIFQFISNGAGTYDIHTLQTTTGRYAIYNSGDVTYATSANINSKWILEDQTLSTEQQIIRNGFEFYPNPVENILYIHTSTSKINKVEVFNVEGKKIITKQFKNNYKINLDVSVLDKGIYFVRVYNTKTIFTEKFIKQ
jgi:hypothetical protein